MKTLRTTDPSQRFTIAPPPEIDLSRPERWRQPKSQHYRAHARHYDPASAIWALRFYEPADLTPILQVVTWPASATALDDITRQADATATQLTTLVKSAISTYSKDIN